MTKKIGYVLTVDHLRLRLLLLRAMHEIRAVFARAVGLKGRVGRHLMVLRGCGGGRHRCRIVRIDHAAEESGKVVRRRRRRLRFGGRKCRGQSRRVGRHVGGGRGPKVRL